MGEFIGGRRRPGNNIQPVLTGLVGVNSRFGGLCGTLSAGIGRSGHFMQGRGDLVDLLELLLHALAGATGDLRGQVRRLAGVVYRALHLGDNRLQFVEEAIERLCQPTQFIAARIIQPTCRSPSPWAISSSLTANSSSGRVTPRALSQINKTPRMAASVPSPNSNPELLRRAASRVSCIATTGASSTSCGTLSNTPHDWLPAAGSSGSSTVMRWLSSTVSGLA